MNSLQEARARRLELLQRHDDVVSCLVAAHGKGKAKAIMQKVLADVNEKLKVVNGMIEMLERRV